MSTRVYQSGPEGKVQAVSSDGEKVAIGDTSLQVVHVPNPDAIWPLGAGRSPRFLDDDHVTWIRPIDLTHAQRYVADLRAFDGGQSTGDKTGLVSGNDFEAAGGHWGSALIAGNEEASGRRIAFDNRILTLGRSGLRMAGRFQLTIRQDTVFEVYENGVFVRQHPKPPDANEYQISTEGWITCGFYGVAHLITPDGQLHDITVAPWGQEGPPRLVHLPDGSVWAWSAMNNRLGQSIVAGRPLRWERGSWYSDSDCITLPDFPATDLSVGMWVGHGFTVAGSANLGTTYPCQIHVAPLNMARAPIPDPQPVVTPLDRPALIGAFFAVSDQYGDAPAYPRHADVVVEATGAAARARAAIVGLKALATVSDPTTVIGLYAGTEDLAALEVECAALRAAWVARWPGRPRPPVIAYVTRGARAQAGYPPQEPDIYAPECYFAVGDTPTAAGIEALVAGWAQTLPADRPWLLSAQAYDLSHAWGAAQMAGLAEASDAYLDALRARPWILGLLWFAVQRPGGVRDYPALLTAHRAIFTAVPSAAVLPTSPAQPAPGDDMTITIGKYDETGKVGEPARIAFTLNSDHPVTELTIDRIGDGIDGLTIRSDDLRPLRAVEVLVTKAGKSAWQLRGKDSAGGHDETSESSRPFVAQA